MKPLVLASTSRYRRRLLERLGLPFEVSAPHFEETVVPGERPEDLVLRQAIGKAESLRERHPEAWIIGSDQVAEVGGEILLKPGTPERAAAQLAALAGREHRLLTAVAVLDAALGERRTHQDVTRLQMRPLSEQQIRAYVARENPVDCAGSYKSEALGIALFEHIRGDDATAVVGLPLMAVTRLLGELGLDVLGGALRDR